MKNIYFVGLPTKQKGIEEFNYIAKRIPQAKFHWFCSKIESSMMKEYKYINFRIGLNDDELRNYIKTKMDYFISCSHYEGFCLPIAEAILLEKLAISYSLKEVRSVYADNIEYVKCFDRNEYIKKINNFIYSNNYSNSRIEQAKNFIVDNYSPSAVSRRFLHILLK